MKFRAPLQSVKHLSDNKIPLCFDFVLTLRFLLGVLRVATLVHPNCLADSSLSLKMTCWPYKTTSKSHIFLYQHLGRDRSQGPTVNQPVKSNSSNGSQIYVTFMKSIVLDSPK